MSKKLKIILSLVCLSMATSTYAIDYQTLPSQEVTTCICPYAQSGPKLLNAPRQGFYIEGFGGGNFLHFGKQKTESLSNRYLPHLRIKAGYIVGSAIGYCHGNGFRNEAEFAYRHNTIKCSSLVEIKHAYTSSITCMVNTLYDFNLYPLKPYVGLGAGYVQHKYKYIAKSFNPSTDRRTHSDFAGQLVAGVNYEIDNKTEVGIKYNYLMAREHFHEQSASLSLKRFF